MATLCCKLTVILLGCAVALRAQSEVNLIWDNASPTYQENWLLELRIDNTIDLSTAQFGLRWDQTNLVLEEMTLGTHFFNAITNEQSTALNFSWLSTEEEGVTIEEGTLVLSMSFSLSHCPQDTVALEWEVNNPPPQFTAWTNDSLLILDATLPGIEALINAPALWETADTSFCVGQSLLLDADCSNCSLWEWSDGTNESSLLVNAPGAYAVTVEDASECIFTDSIEVSLLPLPEVQLRDTVICKDDTLDFEVPVFPGDTFLWSTGDTLPTVALDQAGDYTLTITNTAGCQATDTLSLTFREPTITTLFLDPMEGCLGDTLLVSVDGPDSLQWLTEAVTGPNEEGDFWLIGQDTLVELSLVGVDLCGNDTVRNEVVFHRPLGYAMPDTCIAPNSKVTLEAFNGKSYLWRQPRYDITPNDQSIATSAPLDSATYVVEILDENGCLTIDSVYVAIANDPASFIRPINFISPNQDGHNDYLEFTGLEKYENNELLVWNRWNQVVYRKDQYQLDESRFDGQMNGHYLPDGIYYYRLRIDEVVIEQQLIILRHEK